MATTISVTSTIITSTHVFKADDVTDYSAVTYFVDSKSVLKLQGPSATLYNNTNFASPDFNYPGTLTKSIVIPLISGLIPQGGYILTTTTKITKTCPIIDVNLGSNYILVDLALLDNFIAGQSIVLAGGPNAGTYEIQSVSSNAFGTILTLVEALVSDTATDTVTFDETVETIGDYTYCYTAPSGVLTLEATCESAILTATDNTNYAITCEGESILPTTNTKLITIDAPLNSGGTPVYPQTTSSVSPVVIPELWTQTWTGSLTATLVYTLPSGLIINTSVTTTTHLDVACDDSLCCMSTCLQNATNTFLTAVSCNSNLNAILSATVQYNKILGAFMMYSVGVRCGNTTIIDTAVANMKSYLSDTDCCNNCSDTGQSTQIVAIYNVVISGNTLVVQSGDAYIDISQSVVGDVTTATFTLDVAAVQALIASYINNNIDIITDIVDALKLRVSTFSNDSTAYDVPISFDADTSTGSPIIDNVVFSTGALTDIAAGDPVSMQDFPVGTTISTINLDGSITLSANSTGTSVGQVALIRSEYEGIRADRFKRTLAGVVGYYYKIVLNYQNSIVIDSTTGAVHLSGDVPNPGTNKVYKTNAVGVREWGSPVPSIFTQNAGGTVTSNTSYALATITPTTIGTYAIMLSCQVDAGGAANAYRISIYKNGALINTRAVFYNTSTSGGIDSVSIVTEETLIDADAITLFMEVTSVGGSTADISNISAVLMRIA
jgi:hypothetical protein